MTFKRNSAWALLFVAQSTILAAQTPPAPPQPAAPATAAVSPDAAPAPEAPAQPAEAPATPPETLDPARLQAAHRLVAEVMPVALYRQRAEMISGPTFDTVMRSIMDRPEYKRALTARPNMASVVDRFLTRARQIILDSTLAIMPAYAEAYEHFYARQFTVAQLEELTRFYGTPVGQALAERSILLQADPDMIATMRSQMSRTHTALQPVLTDYAAELADLAAKEDDTDE